MEKLRGRIVIEFDYDSAKGDVWDFIDAVEEAAAGEAGHEDIYITKIEKDTGE